MIVKSTINWYFGDNPKIHSKIEIHQTDSNAVDNPKPKKGVKEQVHGKATKTKHGIRQIEIRVICSTRWGSRRVGEFILGGAIWGQPQL